jgi:GT2 family glycosyltransferase/glycosyltransferase involved in cell wall biosynthesis
MTSAQPASTELTVVIVTHNSSAVIADCLTGLDAALQGVDRWNLVVVDNASDDNSATAVESLAPSATVIRMGHNAGYAAAINEALKSRGGRANLLVLNPDVRLQAGSACELLDNLARPGVGIVVPRLIDQRGGLHLSLRRDPTISRAFAEALLGGKRASRVARLGEVVGDVQQYDHDHPVDWATGAAMLISRECLETVGPWDESFFLYSEETDFALRARDAGYLTWYTPSALAVHLGGESNTSPALWSLLTANRVQLYRQRHGPLRALLFWLAVLLNEAIRAARGSATHRAGLRALLGRGDVAARASHERSADPPGWICFASVDWWYHPRGHSDFQLMRRIARDRSVLFVNSIGMRLPVPGRSTLVGRRILSKIRSILRFAQYPLSDTPGFQVVTPLIIPLYGSPLMRRLNARLIRCQVRRLANRTNIDVSDAVLMVTIPTAWEVVKDWNHRALVVNRSDLHSAFEETDQSLIRDLENQLLANADAVIYASHSLMETESDRAGERRIFLDHGVDLDRFGSDPGPEPADLRSIPHPRVGFYGGLEEFVVDFALLERLARELPEVSVVLIGDATCSMDQFEPLPNVYWLGSRPYEEIPAYGAGFDVALMPWLRNQWIQHSNPIKLKEYLALGLPVVSTDFPEIHHYADVVAIAADDDAFVALVRAALDGHAVGTTESRRARVAGATWDNRAKDLLAIGEGTRR